MPLDSRNRGRRPQALVRTAARSGYEQERARPAHHKSEHQGMWTALSVCAALSTAQVPAELPQACDALATQALKVEGVPGLSIAVALDGELVFARGYGSADSNAGLSMDEKTRMPLGSLERPLLASVVLNAVDERKLSLAAKLPDCLRGAPAAWSAITLEQLLNGSSGLPSSADWITRLEQRANESTTGVLDRAACLNAMGELPLVSDAGERHTHDTIAWRLVPWILTDAWGAPLVSVLPEQLFARAGLENSGICPENMRPLGYARDCRELDSGREQQLFVAHEPAELRAGLCSTPSDVLRWWTAVQEERLGSSRLIENARLKDGKPTGHGLGLTIETLASSKRWSHDGGIGGFRASFAALESPRLAVCVMATCASARTGRIEQELTRFCLGLEPLERLELSLNAERAAQISGDYQLGTTRVKLFVREGRIVYQSPSEERALEYQGLGRFSAGDWSLVLQPPSGPVEGFREMRRGSETQAKRLR